MSGKIEREEVIIRFGFEEKNLIKNILAQLEHINFGLKYIKHAIDRVSGDNGKEIEDELQDKK